MSLFLNATKEPCWKCGDPLYLVTPAVEGWSYFCGRCRHMTQTRTALQAAMASKPRDAIGVVCAIPCTVKLDLLGKEERSESGQKDGEGAEQQSGA